MTGLEDFLVVIGDRGGEMLPGSGDIAELEVEDLDVLFLDEGGNF